MITWLIRNSRMDSAGRGRVVRVVHVSICTDNDSKGGHASYQAGAAELLLWVGENALGQPAACALLWVFAKVAAAASVCCACDWHDMLCGGSSAYD